MRLSSLSCRFLVSLARSAALAAALAAPAAFATGCAEHEDGLIEPTEEDLQELEELRQQSEGTEY
ncbi:hypothetical protein [Alienimonas sp. DA493]|uniref:hypothetical protein n=1 Tax=Alienimonas sp. DA493 TaxID=3373605 RepID=UPI003754845F